MEIKNDFKEVVSSYEDIICRLCLKGGGKQKNIFEVKDDCVIADLIKMVFNRLTISRADFISKTICAECLEVVWHACQLRQKSIESEQFLNSQLDTVELKQEICDVNTYELSSIKEEIVYLNPPTVHLKSYKETRSQVKCTYCSKTLAKKSLQRHERSCQLKLSSGSSQVVTEKSIRATNNDPSQTVDEKPIGCSFCQNRFSSAAEMKKHLKKVHQVDHPNLLFYYCAHCDFSSNHKLRLEVHIKEVHYGIEKKPFVCSICGNGFLDKRNRRNHLFKVHKVSNENTFFCGLCEFHTLQKSKLELHMKRIHLKTVDDFFCNSCEIICKNNHEKSLHHYAHSDIVELCNQDLQMLGCPLCPEQFQLEIDLLDHLSSHEKEVENDTTACILCSKVLEGGYNQIVEHTKAQHVQKFTHRCIECSRSYFYGMKFLVHIKHHKEKKSLDHLCTECGSAFAYAADLNKHVRIEHKKVYKCPYCVDVVYKSIPAFRQHVDGHTNNRKFKCPLCPKTFSVRNKYNSHYAFHLNDKMNQCSICFKGFEKPFSLKIHMQRHDGTLLKPHQCG